MTMNDPKVWEVWWFEFQFEEDPNITKTRPVIIGAKNEKTGEVAVLAIKVTSHPPRQGFVGEIPLTDWERAGLSKPSTARCSKYMLVPVEAFANCRCCGRLSARDEQAVREVLVELQLIR